MIDLSEDKLWRGYPKSLVSMLDSTLGAIMLYNVIISYQNTGKPFFRFGAPCAHPYYRNGKSWKECIGFSGDDIIRALDVIGYKVTQKNKKSVALEDIRPDFDTKGRLLNANHLVVYQRDFRHRLTWYQLNYQLAKKAIDVYSSGEWKDYIAPITDEMKEIEDRRRRITSEEAIDISSFKDFNLKDINSIKMPPG